MERFFSLLFLLLAVVSPGWANAGATAATPAADGPTYNFPLIAIFSLLIILTLANGLLAVVLKQLASAWWDKQKAERTTTKIRKGALLLIACFLPAAQLSAQESIPAPEVNYLAGVANTDFYFLLGTIGFMLIVMVVFLTLIQMFAKALREVPAPEHIAAVLPKRSFLDAFNKSVSLEREKDILLDHNYDGIHELDNDLPPWWKYGFILTIIVAFVYAGYYHAAGGPSQAEEYNRAVAIAEIERAEYLAKAASNVDEHTVTTVLDQVQLTEAQSIFQTTCAACHLKDGGGSVGPNLTDDYWLHGGSIKDVFSTIKYGWPDKGMKSWKDDYSPRQIAALASFIKTLKGTKPLTPKAPQGELFVEGGEPLADSSGDKQAVLPPATKPQAAANQRLQEPSTN